VFAGKILFRPPLEDAIWVWLFSNRPHPRPLSSEEERGALQKKKTNFGFSNSGAPLSTVGRARLTCETWLATSVMTDVAGGAVWRGAVPFCGIFEE